MKQQMKIKFNDVLEHEEVLWSENDEQKVVITFLQNHWIQRCFRTVFRLKIPKQKELIFDEKTSVIWKMIDGKKTVSDIYNEFQNRYTEEKTDDLEARVGTVIHYFASQKWIHVKE